MAYSVEWLVNKRVIYMVTSGTATIEDVKNANREIMGMLAEGIPFVHLITDATRVEKADIGLGDLITMIKTVPSSPKLGWSIYVSSNKLDRFFASVVTQISKARNREFNTLDEALAFLTENDDTLPEIPLP